VGVRVPGPGALVLQVGRERAPLSADLPVVRQRAQGVGLTWLAVVARDEVLALELLPRAELARPEQRDEIVQLAQVVLERRSGEQEDEVPLDFLNELVGRAAVTLYLVRLVHDHQVPAVPQDLLGVAA